VVGRLGGDEFVVVVPDAAETELEARAASLSEQLDRLEVPAAAQALYRGARVGAALAEPGEPPELLIRRATQHMRTNKRRRKGDRAA
jgi:GGDEF domain-containing protein